nr:MAG TPA: hypothetical protein [Caudoviricetes sp.]
MVDINNPLWFNTRTPKPTSLVYGRRWEGHRISARYSAPSRGRNPALPSKEPRRRHGARERDCSDVRISALSCVGDRLRSGCSVG